MSWFPMVFFPLKILVIIVGMFFSIKWHYDQDRKKQNEAMDREHTHDQTAQG